MIYFRGIPLRRIQLAWQDSRRDAAHYLIETWEPRLSCVVRADRLGADDGVDEILRTVQLRSGQILERLVEHEK